jgi:hypothetical protein
MDNPLGLTDNSIREMTDAMAKKPGYYDWRQQAYDNPDYVQLLLEEMQGLRYAATKARVYFVQQGAGGPIKIGATRNFDKRLRTLNTGSHVPLTVLGVVAGGYELERSLRAELADDRLFGEWFKPTDRVLAALASTGK